MSGSNGASTSGSRPPLADAVVEARVAAMLARFREIDATMRDLPFHNPLVEIDAVGFRDLGGEIAGVLVTPWFMNIMLLPAAPDPAVDWNRMGHKRLVDLPAGPRHFMYGGDEALGVYWIHSLHSPMDAFKVKGQARAAAKLEVATLFAAPEPPPEAASPPATVAEAKPAGVDRRSFLRGGG